MLTSSGPSCDGGAEEGLHGALGVRRDEDEAAGGGEAFGERRGVVGDAEGADVVGEDVAELVVGDLADVGGRVPPRAAMPAMVLAAEPPEDFDAGAHDLVEALGVSGVDEGHGALGEVVLGEKGVVCLGEHVDDGVADGGDVESLVVHGKRPRSSNAGVWD